MFKFLKKYLLCFLLFPVLPAFRVDGDGAGGDGDKGGDDGDKGGDDEANKDKKEDKKEDEKLFSQEQLDSVIGKRLAKEKKAWDKAKKEEEDKAKLSETDRLKLEKADAEKASADVLKTANERLAKAVVMTKAVALKIVDPDAAYTLMDKTDVDVSDSGKVTGIDEALAKLIKDKPYLIGEGVVTKVTKVGDDQNNDKKTVPTGTMNDLIRRAAGH